MKNASCLRLLAMASLLLATLPTGSCAIPPRAGPGGGTGPSSPEDPGEVARAVMEDPDLLRLHLQWTMRDPGETSMQRFSNMVMEDLREAGITDCQSILHDAGATVTWSHASEGGIPWEGRVEIKTSPRDEGTVEILMSVERVE